MFISNIGTFSEEWLLHFNALVGGKPISPIEISVARKNSAYFAATEAQTPATALFFLKTTEAHHLKDAPGGAEYLKKDDESLVPRGKEVFAERCARCHSSKVTRSTGAGSGSIRLCGKGLSQLLEQVLGVDQDFRFQRQNEEHRHGTRLPRWQLSVQRT